MGVPTQYPLAEYDTLIQDRGTQGTAVLEIASV